MKNLTRSY